MEKTDEARAGRVPIRVGDASNAYIDEDGRRIVYRVTRDNVAPDYDETRYRITKCRFPVYKDSSKKEEFEK